MNARNKAVLVNIIGAVESGGQIYGKRDYAAYEEPYANTPNEHTITLGWHQAYGYEACAMINHIFTKYYDTAARIDAEGLISRMLDKDWVKLKWKPSRAEKSVLIALIDSDEGHLAQDELFTNTMDGFIADCTDDYTTDVKAQMMYCEIRHLGGKSAVKRIFDRCKGDYRLDSIMAALKADQSDKKSESQVGDKIFWSRHVKCREFIEKYAGEEPMSYQIEDLIAVAEKETGYLEKSYAAYKKNPAVIYEKTEGAGSDNVTKYGKDLHDWIPEAGDTYAYDYQWCDMYVDWAFVVAFSKEGAKELLHGWSAYTPTSAAFFQKAGQWHTENPKRGDIVFFKNSTRICHTGIVLDYKDGVLYTIEGNTGGASGLVANGGGVRKKTYGLPSSYVAGFGRPAYGEQDPDEKEEYRKEFAEDKKKKREGAVTLYRLYNKNTGEHFYTHEDLEVSTLIDTGWRYEGIAWYSPEYSTLPVFRLYNPNSGDHHYTKAYAEKNMLVKVGWSYEGIGWYSDPEQHVPVYRQYNPNAKTGTHNYTTSRAERDYLVSIGWRDEGIGWYAV